MGRGVCPLGLHHGSHIHFLQVRPCHLRLPESSTCHVTVTLSSRCPPGKQGLARSLREPGLQLRPGSTVQLCWHTQSPPPRPLKAAGWAVGVGAQTRAGPRAASRSTNCSSGRKGGSEPALAWPQAGCWGSHQNLLAPDDSCSPLPAVFYVFRTFQL